MNTEQGRKAARYFGAECQANRGEFFANYKEDIACYYEVGSWSELPSDEQAEARRAFHEGKEAEKKAQKD